MIITINRRQAHGAALALFVACATASCYPLDNTQAKKAEEERRVARLDRAFEKSRQEAAAKHPNLPLDEAMQKQGVEVSREKLASLEGSKLEQTRFAMGAFWGYYLSNTRARSGYCKELGVDIIVFVRAFEIEHDAEYTKVTALAVKHGPQLDDQYRLIQRQLRINIDIDMKNFAVQEKTSLKAACQILADEGSEIAKGMHFKDRLPDVHRVLMAN